MSTEYDYRKTFIDPVHGRMAPDFEMVNINFTPVPSPFSPWPKRRVGTVTTSVVDLHNKTCGLLFKREDREEDCRCPRWFAYLRQQIKKGAKQ